MAHSLVPSDRVEGTPVYGRNNEKLGTIERLMLDKMSGMVVYAVIKNGGLFAVHHHYPVSWSALRYNPERHCYACEITLERLRNGPSEVDDTFDWGDRSLAETQPHYWGV